MNKIRERKFVSLDDLSMISGLSGFKKTIKSKAKELYHSNYSKFYSLSDNVYLNY